jgi:hypothetical protein
MEGGVEDGDIRDAGQRGFDLLDPRQRCRVVKRSERFEREDPLADGGVDEHRLAGVGAPVNDAVRDAEQRRPVDRGNRGDLLDLLAGVDEP